MSAPLLSRGLLLREITRLADDIVGTHARFNDVSGRLQREVDSIARLQEELKDVGRELESIEAQRKFESENDTELSTLQNVVAALTLRRAELIRITKQARADRDSLREGCHSAYYARIGAASEAAMVSALLARDDAPPAAASASLLMAASSGAPAWSTASVSLLQQAEALWRKSSTLSESTRDLVEGALALRGLAVSDDSTGAHASGDHGHGQAQAAPAAALYLPLGDARLLSDAERAATSIAGLADECDTLARCCEAAASDCGSCGLDAATAVVASVRQHLHLQRLLLRSILGDAVLARCSSGADSGSEDRDRDRDRDAPRDAAHAGLPLADAAAAAAAAGGSTGAGGGTVGAHHGESAVAAHADVFRPQVL